MRHQGEVWGLYQAGELPGLDQRHHGETRPEQHQELKPQTEITLRTLDLDSTQTHLDQHIVDTGR